MTITVTPIPKLSDFATPGINLSTTAAAGSADTVIRSDSTIVAFDSSDPAPLGTAAATGSANVAARRDHVHNGTSTPWTTNVDAATYTLSNVGHADNDWTATVLTQVGRVDVGAGPDFTAANSTRFAVGDAANGTWCFQTDNTQGVSTSATTILTGSYGGLGAAFAVVYGKDQSANHYFMDQVVWSDAGDSATATASTTVYGSQQSRTYSVSGSNFRLAMASGTYDVNVLSFEGAYPN